MASIKRFGNKWRAIINKRVDGKAHRPSEVFPTKTEAQAWAAMVENEIESGKRGQVKSVTFGKLLERYAEEESPKHKGVIWERNLIRRFKEQPLYSSKLGDLSANDFGKWRNSRLKTVSEGTVRREWILLSSAINVAIKEWQWLTVNPLKDLKRPKDGPSRDRLFSSKEIESLTYILGADKPPTTISSRVGYAMLFAMETGMRAGEILGLRWDDIKGRTAAVREGKTASAKREVPLTLEAIRILELLSKDTETCFDITNKQRDALFRKAMNKTGITDLHFHDSRANACTKLAKQVDILSLAKIIGHKNINQLQVYYRDTAQEIAERLN
ncbi:site-specific integrase [Polynucleobacter paludilacus]|uniref:tyrosine-type recombinase/integrase n=1 Tax=Polynucleobacter paludilacus TaxID=1855895 RepID=UPI001BFD6671|nr:site-specific integrase [Polynucleobacter paludilacus]QWD87676.1 site-specific integrase [Polynucleobacter paludilacus]